MLFIQLFLLITSVLLLVYIAVYAFTYRRVPGATAVVMLMVSGIIWSTGAFLELMSGTFEVMLFWRNIQQIGAFSGPYILFLFAVEYTGRQRLRPVAAAGFVIASLAVLLIFTNEYHHIMRSGYELDGSWGTLVVIRSTFGSILVGLNYIAGLSSLLLMGSHIRRVSAEERSRVRLVLISMVLTLVGPFLKTAVFSDLGIHISISVYYLPGALLIFYAMRKYDFFNIYPVARDTVFQVLRQGIMVLDWESRIVDINPSAEALLGQLFPEIEQIRNKSVIDLIPEDNRLLQICSEEGDAEIKVLETGRHYLFQSHRIYRKGIPGGMVVIAQDITQLKRQELDLRRLSETDSLTGLYNRRKFQATYESLCHRRPLSLLMIDIDRFKQINDTYGHSIGDQVIKGFADLLQSYEAARLGGEEFGLFLPDIDRLSAYGVAEKLRTQVEAQGITLPDGRTIAYTSSIGITDTNLGGSSYDQLLHQADTAMYQAKQRSRNTTVIYET